MVHLACFIRYAMLAAFQKCKVYKQCEIEQDANLIMCKHFKLKLSAF